MPARRIRLGCRADSGARGHLVAGAAAKDHAVGQSQRVLLRARSHNRRVPAGHAHRETELERRLRQRPADSHARTQCRRARACSSTRATRARPTGSIRRYSPRTGLFYVNVWENTHHIFARADQSTRRAPATRRDGSPRTILGEASRRACAPSNGRISVRKRRISARFARSIRRPESGDGNTSRAT